MCHGWGAGPHAAHHPPSDAGMYPSRGTSPPPSPPPACLPAFPRDAPHPSPLPPSHPPTHLVNEHHAGRELGRQAERRTDVPHRVPKPLGGHGAGAEGQEGSAALGRRRPGQQGFAGPWGAEEQHALGGAGQGATREELGVVQRQLDGLAQRGLGVGQCTHLLRVGEGGTGVTERGPRSGAPPPHQAGTRLGGWQSTQKGQVPAE